MNFIKKLIKLNNTNKKIALLNQQNILINFTISNKNYQNKISKLSVNNRFIIISLIYINQNPTAKMEKTAVDIKD